MAGDGTAIEIRHLAADDVRLLEALSTMFGEVFGDADVAHDPRERSDELRGLDAPYGVDGAVDVGSHDGYRSHHQ